MVYLKRGLTQKINYNISKERGDKYMKSLGEKIRELRNSLGLSQEELAEELGITSKSIQRSFAAIRIQVGSIKYLEMNL